MHVGRMTMPERRPLDHLVLSVEALSAARSRLTALGFTVAPDGVHPFGTANCCVFLADGTFLEPLATADLQQARRAADAGNVFVRHDADFRTRNGAEGFSALVYGTTDALADHQTLVRLDISAGDILDFGRDFITADGTRDRAEFRLAFANSEAAPDCLFFTCERVAVPNVDRSALQRHANGATSITEVIIVAADPAAHVEFLENVSGASAAPSGNDGLAIRSGSFELVVLTQEVFADRTGLAASAETKPQFRAVAFSGADTGDLETRFRENGVAFHRAPAGLVVPPAPGQGAAFIFPSSQAA